jgi:hypothetical protein
MQKRIGVPVAAWSELSDNQAGTMPRGHPSRPLHRYDDGPLRRGADLDSRVSGSLVPRCGWPKDLARDHDRAGGDQSPPSLRAQKQDPLTLMG